MKLSIIVPVFNEEQTIAPLLSKVLSVKLSEEIKSIEVIVVDDGSTDLTSEHIRIKRRSIRYIKHNKNLGKGAAIRSGLKKVSGDIILIQDGDLEYDPKYYSKLLEPIIQNKTKVVYGTRLKTLPFRIFSKDKTPYPLHFLGNKFLTSMTNLLYRSNLTDMETGYKVFKKDVISNLKLVSDGFDIEPEVTAKVLKAGHNIVEVPINTIPRTYKEGKKITWTDGIIALWILLKNRFS